MKRITITCTIIAVVFIAAAGSSSAQVTVSPPGNPAPLASAPAIASASGIVFDLASGKIFWAKDDQVQRAPASLTKIMTALVAIEEGNLNAPVVISPEARTAPGGRMYAEQGWTFKLKDLLYGLLLQSGNDAAVALAQGISPDGSVAGFVQMMNDKAMRLGANNTHFVNPHGYDEPGHVTTARDLAIISTAAMKNRLFAEMVSKKTVDVPWGDGAPHTFINHNRLLWRYEGAVGIKTGFTDLAGHSLASAATRDGTTLVGILLGSPNAIHYDETQALFDWSFAHKAELSASPLGTIPAVKQAETRVSTKNKKAGEGLEIVQLGADRKASPQPATNPISAPLLAPSLALLAAGVIGTVLVRRRRKRSTTYVMQQFHRQLEAISPNGSPLKDASSNGAGTNGVKAATLQEIP